MSADARSDRVPLPPPDAKVYTTACAYCVVGCGYKAYVWPQGTEGGLREDENAFGARFPTLPLQPWVSPNQHNVVRVDGRPHHVVVVPDFRSAVVNKAGNHSIRGGTLALKCYNPDGPTRDRLQHPQIRVNGQLTDVSWDTALEVMAAVSDHVLRRHGASAWAMKTYSYEFFENTYAITKLAFGAIGTPAFAQHDKPSMGSDTGGVDDAGIITFSASFQDWADAEVIYISGTDPFETKTVLFTSWMMGEGKRLIFALPRRTAGVAYAEARGGLFLQLVPGTDTLLHLAIARVILENGREDRDFIERWVAGRADVKAEEGDGPRYGPRQWRIRDFGTDYAGYRDWLLGYDPARLENAERVTGVPAAKIRRAAEMLTGARGARPKASFGFEKGNYWSNNYPNTASFAALALLTGAGNRPGRVISRLGGHQRGWMGAAPYPLAKAPVELADGRMIELDLDRWVEAGNVRFVWVIGTTWTAAMAGSSDLAASIRRRTVESPHQIRSRDTHAMIDVLLARIDDGGMVLVDSDIYPVAPLGTELADIVLPAAAWGEHDASRANGERRMRLYSKFYDPPGEAQPDWWAVSRFAQKMGFAGFDWSSANDLFEEAAGSSRGGVLDYSVLVWRAREAGRKGHELLRELGTQGIQTPIRWASGRLEGTARLHDSTLELGAPEGPTTHPGWLTRFASRSGKALLLVSPWELFSDFHERVKPDTAKGEFWLSTGRINEVWQSGFDDSRKPYIHARWPDTWVEIHPDDATRNGIESGDVVRLFSDDILIQVGDWEGPRGYRFDELASRGLIRRTSGEARAVAIVSADVRPGVLFTNFLHPASPANSLVHRVPDPFANVSRFKLGKAQVEKIGVSPYKSAFDAMSFKPRTVMR